MDMMCDGHLDCADMLSSVTGLRIRLNSSPLLFHPLRLEVLNGNNDIFPWDTFISS